jgi:hypothetical protein
MKSRWGGLPAAVALPTSIFGGWHYTGVDLIYPRGIVWYRIIRGCREAFDE